MGHPPPHLRYRWEIIRSWMAIPRGPAPRSESLLKDIASVRTEPQSMLFRGCNSFDVPFRDRPKQSMRRNPLMGGIMKIIYAFVLLAGVSIAASGQSEFSKQTVAVNPPFTLTISYNQLNPNKESTADQVVESGHWVAFRIRKTNISDHEIMKMS